MNGTSETTPCWIEKASGPQSRRPHPGKASVAGGATFGYRTYRSSYASLATLSRLPYVLFRGVPYPLALTVVENKTVDDAVCDT